MSLIVPTIWNLSLIAAAEARKAEREVSFQASCAKKGDDNVICAVM
jgi:hypothetical protein